MAILIITDKPGQTGNQLWAYVNMVALARAAGKKAVLLLEDDLSSAFKRPEINGLKIIDKQDRGFRIWDYFLQFVRFRYKKKLWSAFFRIIGIQYREGYLAFSDLNEAWKRKGLLLCESWPNRHHKNVEMLNREEIRNCFIFKDDIQLKVKRILDEIKQRHTFLVGVHVRRGDYKDFMGGKYFYSDEVYLEKMKQVKSFLYNKNVAFILCSNVLLTGEILGEENVFYFEDNSGPEDMYLLSSCDLILGPPSTFSMWASYYSKKPLAFIDEKDKVISLRGFKRVLAQDVFE